MLDQISVTKLVVICGRFSAFEQLFFGGLRGGQPINAILLVIPGSARALIALWRSLDKKSGIQRRDHMNKRRNALMTVIDRVAKLVPLLASDRSGEVVSAAGHLVQVLAKAGLDLHDVVDLLREDPIRARVNSPFETDQEALIRLGSTGVRYFLTSDREVFADIVLSDHRETWPLSSTQFSEWLMHRFFEEKQRIPTGAQLRNALHFLRARASLRENDHHDVHLRIAEHDGKIYLDLADSAWRTVEISAEGWRIVNGPPVRFRRTAAMRPLPTPKRGGSIDDLRQFINVDGANFTLAVAFVLDALRVGRPHPVLYMAGGEGTAKSTATLVLASLIDPHHAKVRSLPAVRDLFVAAQNQALLCFDNISVISPSVSDALCQVSSGIGFAKRKNFTDDAEFRISGSRAMILNGIDNCITRPDLADRSIVLNLPRIDRRRAEGDFWAAFEAAQPNILGAILDLAVHGLANLSKVHVQNPIRNADFQRWAAACLTAVSDTGALDRALAANMSDTVETLVDNDPVAKAVGALMVDRSNWSGTAAELLIELTRHDYTEARVSRLPNWPRDPARLSKALRALQATLAKAGISVEFGKALDRRRTRTVHLRNRGTTPPSQSGSVAGKPRLVNTAMPAGGKEAL